MGKGAVVKSKRLLTIALCVAALGTEAVVLEWIGKSKVVNHHLDVPCHVLEKKWSHGGTDSGNMVIKGDNLLALKALLPRYAGKVKCIYIDPPYNTGNEGWCYNDNVNDPTIQRWLNKVVGKEGEDFTRHDKWLCMMYPRLKLLQQLLADDGAIVIHIDENEIANLLCICAEIFGLQNSLGVVVWDKKNPKGETAGIAQQHEYIVYYAKNKRVFAVADYFYQDKEHATQMLTKAKSFIRQFGGVNEQSRKAYLEWVRANNELSGGEKAFSFIDDNGDVYQTVSMAAPDKPETRCHTPLQHPITGKDCPVPAKGWRNKWERMQELLDSGEIVFGKDESTQPRRKYLLKDNTKERVPSLLHFGATDDVCGVKFDTPKPVKVAQRIVDSICKDGGIVLDSFAGSGTTAHAVLNLNKLDGGNRKFILVEMCDYAETITAERVKRVIDGYGEESKHVEGTGGAFSFYELGEPLMVDDELNEKVATGKIREYIYYTEVNKPLPDLGAAAAKEPYLLGVEYDTAYYFCYEKGKVVTLDRELLRSVRTKADQYVIYADKCALSEAELRRRHITFKKIPRDITRL